MLRSLLLATAALLVVGAASAGTTPLGGGGYEPPPPPTSPPPPPPPAASGTSALVATVGPAATIKLTRAGKRVRRLAAGRYTVTVRDRAAEHNFHLVGPGVNKKTGVAFTGTATWTVRFRKGKVYRYRCDAHLFSMKASFRAT